MRQNGRAMQGYAGTQLCIEDVKAARLVGHGHVQALFLQKWASTEPHMHMANAMTSRRTARLDNEGSV